MFTRRNLLQSLLAAPALALPMAPRAMAFTAQARQMLSDGQAVVYFRHCATTWSGIDQLDWPRERQHLLSDLGIQHSEQIGAGFRVQ